MHQTALAKLNGVSYILSYSTKRNTLSILDYRALLLQRQPTHMNELWWEKVCSRFQVKWKSQFTEIENLIFNRQRCGNGTVSYDLATRMNKIYGWINCRIEIDLASNLFIFFFLAKTTDILCLRSIAIGVTHQLHPSHISCFFLCETGIYDSVMRVRQRLIYLTNISISVFEYSIWYIITKTPSRVAKDGAG